MKINLPRREIQITVTADNNIILTCQLLHDSGNKMTVNIIKYTQN